MSALDTKVGDALFNNVIIEHLAQKTWIIVTHNVTLLDKFNRILFIEDGKIIYDGNYDELQKLS